MGGRMLYIRGMCLPTPSVTLSLSLTYFSKKLKALAASGVVAGSGGVTAAIKLKFFSCEFFLTVDKQWFRQVSVISAEIKKAKNIETLPKSSDVHIPLCDYFLNDECLHQLHLCQHTDALGDRPRGRIDDSHVSRIIQNPV